MTTIDSLSDGPYEGVSGPSALLPPAQINSSTGRYSIVEVTTKRQIIFPFSKITTQNNGNKSSFERENREIWRLVVTATICIME